MSRVQFFVKIDGIPGDSQDAQHRGEIDAESWSWGEVNTPAGAGSSAGSASGRVQMRDFVFAARISQAGPKLLLACASGQRIRSAVLSARRSGTAPRDILTVALSDVQVTSYDTGSREETADLFDRVALRFARIQVEYRGQASDGSLLTPVKVGWDVVGNQPL